MILRIELWFRLIIMSLLSSAHFIEVPINISAAIGETVTFRCSAGENSVPIVYSQWKSNTGSLLGYHQEGVLPGHQGRYSYIKQNSEQLHLQIEHVTLDDDGKYECQMLHPEEGPIRAKAFLNILVPPVDVHFLSYQPNAVIPVKEDTQLNITCVAPNVKPEPRVVWYIDGKKFNNNSPQFSTLHINKTHTVYSSLVLRAGRKDNGKTLTCEVFHESTNTKTTANATLYVIFPPSDPIVSITGRSGSIESGENVTISCLVTSGNPSPDLYWYHEEKRLPSFFSLDAQSEEIRNEYSFIASPSDNLAEYECRANNSHNMGYKKNMLRLKVEFPPPDVELFGESTIRYGKSTIIQCKSLPSNPASQIKWKINGRSVATPTQKEEIVKNGMVSSSNISIHQRELPDANLQVNVECSATNDKGTTTRQHVIKIIAPPKMPVITGLDNVHYFEGDMINLTCEAKGGNPLAELSWYRGNEKINGAYDEVAGASSFSSLSLRLDRTMNSQRIKCEAINLAIDEPLVESRQLTVHYLPRHVVIRSAKNQDHRFPAGKPARLVCEALSSNPASQISWKFPKETKFDTGDTIFNQTTNFNVENVISFVPTEDDDGSVIHCIASHPDWKRTMNTSYSLNVLYSPKMLVKGDINVILSEGDFFKENLTIKSNPPISSWQWRKDGMLFDHTVGRVFARGPVLSGKKLMSTDGGAYTLTATNSLGSTNITINLVVEYGAKITSISTPVIAAVGDTVLLECEADAEPRKPNMINWYKNNDVIPSKHIGDSKAVIELNATQNGSGEFICRADNGVGSPAESKTFVLVNSAPKLHQIPRFAKTAGTLGGTAKARCVVHAVPNVDLVWETNGQMIKTNNSKYLLFTTQLDYSTYESTLWIKNIVPDDYSKSVKCIARNSFGTDTMSIPIVFPTNPDQPFNLAMINSTFNTISVFWEPGFDGGSEQLFEVKYRMENNDILHLVNTTHTHLRVSGLKTATAYTFQLRSINSKGFASTWTNPVMFSTLNENGVNISIVNSQRSFLLNYLPYLLTIAVIFILIHAIVCCFLCNRTKKRKLREKTEQVRAAIKGDVRQVQMYGAMAMNEDMSHLEFDDKLEMSEDEHSVRTMIEVSPNGYMQPIEPTLYDNSGMFKYNLDTRNYSSPHHTLNRNITYANVPYPEPPQLVNYVNGQTGHQQMVCGNNPKLNLSTFINPNVGVRAGPINYMQLDGDLV